MVPKIPQEIDYFPTKFFHSVRLLLESGTLAIVTHCKRRQSLSLVQAIISRTFYKLTLYVGTREFQMTLQDFLSQIASLCNKNAFPHLLFNQGRSFIVGIILHFKQIKSKPFPFCKEISLLKLFIKFALTV